MDLKNKIQAFVELGNKIKLFSHDDVKRLSVNAEAKNGWFTEENVGYSLKGIESFLEQKSLEKWLSNYTFKVDALNKVGLILAGNIPLVGFHDVLCVLLSGNVALLKLSSEDSFLMKELLKMLVQIEPEFQNRFQYVEMLKEAEAFIGTGSNNSARYFEQYFAERPSIIRKNRTSVAILKGSESQEELEKLGKDVFQYFGLGCRNVSKLLVPKDYKLDPVFVAFEPWNYLFDHHKYSNNYTYNHSIYLLGKEQFLENGFFMIKESSDLVAPVSVLFVERYDNEKHLSDIINRLEEHTQCIASENGWYENSLPFGSLQNPGLSDYADNVDTMLFLEKL